MAQVVVAVPWDAAVVAAEERAGPRAVEPADARRVGEPPDAAAGEQAGPRAVVGLPDAAVGERAGPRAVVAAERQYAARTGAPGLALAAPPAVAEALLGPPSLATKYRSIRRTCFLAEMTCGTSGT